MANKPKVYGSETTMTPFVKIWLIFVHVLAFIGGTHIVTTYQWNEKTSYMVTSYLIISSIIIGVAALVVIGMYIYFSNKMDDIHQYYEDGEHKLEEEEEVETPEPVSFIHNKVKKVEEPKLIISAKKDSDLYSFTSKFAEINDPKVFKKYHSVPLHCREISDFQLLANYQSVAKYISKENWIKELDNLKYYQSKFPASWKFVTNKSNGL